MRVGVGLLATIFAIGSAQAATTAKKKPAATKKHKKKRKVVAKRAKHSRHVAIKHVAAEAAEDPNGRVKYGPSNMPPGFSWPPNPEMKAAATACERELSARGLEWKHEPGEGKINDPIGVPAMEIGGIKYKAVYTKPPWTMDCQLVHVLVDIGPPLYALGVREIRFGSIYRNTLVRVHGMTKNILSRHALGLAMDIKEFVDDKGRVANVELDYLKGDPLLHGIEDLINKSNEFRIVLTPGNDPISHYDHFHIEASVDFAAFR